MTVTCDHAAGWQVQSLSFPVAGPSTYAGLGNSWPLYWFTPSGYYATGYSAYDYSPAAGYRRVAAAVSAKGYWLRVSSPARMVLGGRVAPLGLTRPALAEARRRHWRPLYAEGDGFSRPIARQIVAEHAGALEVDNRPGTGVTFVDKLPVMALSEGDRE